MRFIDEVSVQVRAGDGGDGCIAFLREKYRPKGGPAGGDGGDGGDVVFIADPSLSTLQDLRYHPHIKAESGEQGRGKHQYGKRGADTEIRVPPGTVVHDADDDSVIADLKRAGDRIVIVRGGKGGLGNMHFASSTNQAPRRALPGTSGEQRKLRLELRLLADVGIVGFPSVGKSSFISRVSAARPKVADYPFTTLVPNLGVVRFDDHDSFVLADIPGLIEGAHEGAGLGIRFLRHVRRTLLLVHMIDPSGLAGRDPLRDFETINHELRAFDEELAEKPQIVVANKMDLGESREAFAALATALAERGVELFAISAATGEGVAELVKEIGRRFKALAAERLQLAADEAREDAYDGEVFES
jgi:GTP-binding protein